MAKVKIAKRTTPSLTLEKIGKRTALILKCRYSINNNGKITHHTLAEVLEQFNNDAEFSIRVGDFNG